MGWKDDLKKYAPYFLDFWQYILIIVVFIIVAIFVL